MSVGLKENVNQSYQERDNDLYWLHCKNRRFYVIPEKELIEDILEKQNL